MIEIEDLAGLEMRETRQPTSEEWDEVRAFGEIEDADPTVVVLITNKGQLFIVAENYEGHGTLRFFQKEG